MLVYFHHQRHHDPEKAFTKNFLDFRDLIQSQSLKKNHGNSFLKFVGNCKIRKEQHWSSFPYHFGFRVGVLLPPACHSAEVQFVTCFKNAQNFVLSASPCLFLENENKISQTAFIRVFPAHRNNQFQQQSSSLFYSTEFIIRNKNLPGF